MGWLVVYLRTPHIECADNATVRLDLQNEVQPDALLRLTAGGTSTIGSSGYIEGLPEFVAEVASTSASRDMHAKLDLYLRHGVREYLVWRVLDGAIDWFRLEANEFRLFAVDTGGAIKSRDFLGFGSTQRQCYAATWPACWMSSAKEQFGRTRAVLPSRKLTFCFAVWLRVGLQLPCVKQLFVQPGPFANVLARAWPALIRRPAHPCAASARPGCG